MFKKIMSNDVGVGPRTTRKKEEIQIKKIKQNSAITLIALVITIIVLLILAGITLTFVLGENGLFSKARNAKTATLQAQAEEDIKLKILEYQTAHNGTEPTLNELATYLDENTTEEYDVILKNNSTSTLKNNSVLSNINDSTNEIYVTKTSIGAEVKVTKNLQVEATNKIETGSSEGSNSGGHSSSEDNQTNGTTSRDESSIISDVVIESVVVRSNKIEIKITTESTNSEDVKGYLIYCNQKLNKITTDKEVIIEGLTKNTNYVIYCEALDSDGNSKKSNQLQLKTQNVTYVMATNVYPIITNEGIKNVKFVNLDDETDYYYEELDMNLDEDTYLASDAIRKKAYDNDNESYEGPYTRKHLYINIDSSAWGKTINVTKVSGYQGYLFMNNNNQNIGSTVNNRNTSNTFVIPENAAKLDFYLNESGKIYNMEIE